MLISPQRIRNKFKSLKRWKSLQTARSQDKVCAVQLAHGSRAGEVSEWSKEHAWKVCKSQGFEGSNPSLSATYSEKAVPYGAAFFMSAVLSLDFHWKPTVFISRLLFLCGNKVTFNACNFIRRKLWLNKPCWVKKRLKKQQFCKKANKFTFLLRLLASSMLLSLRT